MQRELMITRLFLKTLNDFVIISATMHASLRLDIFISYMEVWSYKMTLSFADKLLVLQPGWAIFGVLG